MNGCRRDGEPKARQEEKDQGAEKGKPKEEDNETRMQGVVQGAHVMVF